MESSTKFLKIENKIGEKGATIIGESLINNSTLTDLNINSSKKWYCPDEKRCGA